MSQQTPSVKIQGPDIRQLALLCAAAAILLMSREPPVQASVLCDRSSAAPAEAVEALARNPSSILRRHAQADGGLADEAQAIILAGRSGQLALFAAAQTATMAQQEQIGRGIGRAYLQCLRVNSAVAGEIMEAMRLSDDTRLNAAFHDEADVLWTGGRKAAAAPERQTDEIGTSPSDVFGGSMPQSGMTARIGPYDLPPLSGPLPNPFDPIK